MRFKLKVVYWLYRIRNKDEFTENDVTKIPAIFCRYFCSKLLPILLHESDSTF